MPSEDYESKRVECPNCGMPYDVPVEADAWPCDCGVTWEFDPRTDGGCEQHTEGLDRDQESGGVPRLVRDDGTVYLRVWKTLIDIHIVAFVLAGAAIALIELLSRTGVLFN